MMPRAGMHSSCLIDLGFLLEKTTVRLNFKVDLITLHTSWGRLAQRESVENVADCHETF